MTAKPLHTEKFYEYLGVTISTIFVERDWGIETSLPTGWPCAYVYISEETFEGKSLFETLWEPDKNEDWHYYDTWIADLPWHGGVTFYKCEKLWDHWDGYSKPKRWKRFIKVGCDWNHLHDELLHPTEEMALANVEAVVREMIELAPLKKK